MIANSFTVQTEKLFQFRFSKNQNVKRLFFGLLDLQKWHFLT